MKPLPRVQGQDCPMDPAVAQLGMMEAVIGGERAVRDWIDGIR